ncbi:MAG: helix-turn-helix domain-containing protein [Acidimicrobiia bacterium]
MASKEVGRQLRHVRRKQGLSRSEVARSAGLTRRELAAYERGRTDVPESDLWCLAGSCGVDVAELLPNRAPVKVSSDLSLLAIGDSIRYLRNPTDDDEMLREYLAMIYELRNLPPGSRIPLRERDLMALADALGGTPERIEARLIELIGMSHEEASRLRVMILPANALPAPGEQIDPYANVNNPENGPGDAAVVDFFSTPRSADVFEPPPPPGALPSTNGWSDAFDTPTGFGGSPIAPYAPSSPDVVFESFDPAIGPLVDAPLQQAPEDPFGAPMPSVSYAPEPQPEADGGAPPLGFSDAPLAPVWPAAPLADATTFDAPITDWVVDAPPVPPFDGADHSFGAEPGASAFPQGLLVEPPVEDWADAEPLPRRQPLTGPATESFDAAVSLPPTAPAPTAPLPVYESLDPAAAAALVAPVAPLEIVTPPAPPAPPAPPIAYVVPEALAPAPPEALAEPEPFVIPEPPAGPTPAAPPIAWVAHEQPATVSETNGGFHRAGSNWRIGGIFPATATADDGALALRRADARWALADIDAPGDFTAEATVDFSAGAGFGVLFRASVDESDRVSGYSFDIDPIAGGGGYLVRQWEDNRQHWQPIAQASVTDPTLLFGRHTVSVTLRADQLTVIVDNEAVLSVPALSRRSIELGRPPCRGTRVGVQAWATTEVTIDSFLVARY